MKWFVSFIILILFTEFYSFIGAKNLASGSKHGYWFYIAYALSVALFISFFVVMFYNFSQKNYVSTPLKNFFYGFAFSVFVAKLIFASFMFFWRYGSWWILVKRLDSG
jgi:hypothetical protein